MTSSSLQPTASSPTCGRASVDVWREGSCCHQHTSDRRVEEVPDADGAVHRTAARSHHQGSFRERFCDFAVQRQRLVSRRTTGAYL